MAVIWRDGGNARHLSDVLIENGATGLSGWTLTQATGISADGIWVVGYGLDPNGFREAFRANIRPSTSSTGGGGALDGVSLLVLGLIGWRSSGCGRQPPPNPNELPEIPSCGQSSRWVCIDMRS